MTLERCSRSRTESWLVVGRDVGGSATRENTTVSQRTRKSRASESECPCSEIIERSSSRCRSPAQTRGFPDTWSTVRPRRWNEGSPWTCCALSLAGQCGRLTALFNIAQENNELIGTLRYELSRDNAQTRAAAPSCARMNSYSHVPSRAVSPVSPWAMARLSAPVRLPLQCVKDARAQTKQP